MASKRKSLCIDEKVLLIRAIERGEKIGDVGKRFGFSRSTVSTIWKNKEKILQAELDGRSSKKLKKPKYEDLDQVMLSWFHRQLQFNLPVSGPIMKAQAEKFAEKLGLTAFKASEGWLGKFKQRHHINFGIRHYNIPQNFNDYLQTNIEVEDSLAITTSLPEEEYLDSERVSKEEQQEYEEVEADGPEAFPSIKQALDAAKLLEKYFLINQLDPTLSQVMNKIRKKILYNSVVM